MEIYPGTSITASERWYDEIRAGRAFGGVVTSGAGVGVLSHTQLFNPAGSAVTILVYALEVSVVSAIGIYLTTHNVALLTAETTLLNLLSGGAAPVGQVRRENFAALQGTPFNRALLLASTKIPLMLPWLIELGAGEGLDTVADTANTAIIANYFWMEV